MRNPAVMRPQSRRDSRFCLGGSAAASTRYFGLQIRDHGGSVFIRSCRFMRNAPPLRFSLTSPISVVELTAQGWRRRSLLLHRAG